jgi:transcriptional regulator with XRE-family HTH domain
MALAELLKRLREDRGISQEQLAFALSRIERGLNNPGWMTVKRLAAALDVTLVRLAGEVESARR